MFVRLFVDENLDRMVPISKQPKEKIQAIIESCSRQFPEFQERARKRIRTYLKSCRRMKKNGMEMVSPRPLGTPSHGPGPGSHSRAPGPEPTGSPGRRSPDSGFQRGTWSWPPSSRPIAGPPASPISSSLPFCPQTRPTPPHLTSAMAENILAAACESETRKAAKRMRLEMYQSSQVPTRPVPGHAHGPPVTLQ